VSTGHPHISGRKRWLFRLLAMLLSLMLLGMVEGVCRLLGLGEPDLADDPFVGFNELQPLFVKHPDEDRFYIPPARSKFFVEDSFPVQKAPGTFRIFVLGGSTVQGNPFSIETAFPAWLKIALEEAQPQTRWEVINCGGISYASYRLVPVLMECLQHQPDLVIFCEGHNEFLEDRSYAGLRDQSPLIAIPLRWAARLSSFQLARALLAAPATDSNRPTLRNDVDAMLDYNEGTQAYHRDEVWRAGVIEHFEFNLERMVRIARKHTIRNGQSLPLMLILPPSNLADMPPFKSEHRTGLTLEEQNEFVRLLALADTPGRDAQQVLESLEAARTIDPQFAALRYRLGRFYEALGRHEEARSEFLAARDEDICPLRIITPLEQVIRQTAQRWSLPFVDAAALLEQQTRHGIADGSLLVDHVHPSFEGHQLIALAILEEMSRTGLVVPQPGWKECAQLRFRKHFESLPPVYFAKGQQTLHRHNEWAKGRAAGPHIRTRHPERIKPAEPIRMDDAALTY